MGLVSLSENQRTMLNMPESDPRHSCHFPDTREGYLQFVDANRELTDLEGFTWEERRAQIIEAYDSPLFQAIYSMSGFGPHAVSEKDVDPLPALMVMEKLLGLDELLELLLNG